MCVASIQANNRATLINFTETMTEAAIWDFPRESETVRANGVYATVENLVGSYAIIITKIICNAFSVRT